MIKRHYLAPQLQPAQLPHDFVSYQAAPYNEPDCQGMSGAPLSQYLRQLLHGNRQCLVLVRDIAMQHRPVRLRSKVSITFGTHSRPRRNPHSAVQTITRHLEQPLLTGRNITGTSRHSTSFDTLQTGMFARQSVT